LYFHNIVALKIQNLPASGLVIDHNAKVHNVLFAKNAYKLQIIRE